MKNDFLIDKINNLCNEQNLAISDLLDKANLSAHLIEDWTANKCAPSIPALSKICEILNVELSSLFKNDEISLTKSQENILNEWKQLSDIEKNAIIQYINALKDTKN